MGHRDGGGGVLNVRENGLDREGGGAGALDELSEVGVELVEAVGDGGDVAALAAAQAEDAGLDQVLTGDGALDAGVAGDAEAGIDAEDAHAFTRGYRLAG